MDRHVLPDDIVKRDSIVLGKEFELEPKELRDSFLAGKAAEQKCVGSERRINP
jgi:hypothetical protein